FDLLHRGHVRLMAEARSSCDRLVVGLNSDASVRRLKGPQRPIQDVASRADVLAALEAVDLVVVFEEDTPLELIRAVRPAVLVKGGDYTREGVVGHDVVARNGGARVAAHSWKGFGAQKNYALSLAQGDWVLSIDADERVTPELAQAIRAAIATGAADAYEIPRRSTFCGRMMRHSGWFPDRVLRV